MKKVEQGAIVTVPRVDPDAGMEASRTELLANREEMSKWKVHTERDSSSQRDSWTRGDYRYRVPGIVAQILQQS